MSSLTAIFGRTPEKPRDSEKLLHLYWNRAELKKEFARMRKEQFKLRDCIKQQEGSAARLQQKLDHLEALLIDPEWASNVLVYFQLRGLVLRCELKVARLAEQLKRQREQRQHNHLLVRWNDERTRACKALDDEIGTQREAARQLEERLDAERQRFTSMTGLLRFLRKRSATAALDQLTANLDRIGQREQELRDDLEEIRNRRPPENQGLDIQTKRSINFMIISFVQQLYLHFSDNDLAEMAKEAGDKSVGAVNYGNRHECNQLLERIRKRLEGLERIAEAPAVLQRRAKLIGEQAGFRAAGDAVPIAATVTTIFDIDDDGSVRTFEGNLLGENYWGIARVLSR